MPVFGPLVPVGVGAGLRGGVVVVGSVGCGRLFQGVFGGMAGHGPGQMGRTRHGSANLHRGHTRGFPPPLLRALVCPWGRYGNISLPQVSGMMRVEAVVRRYPWFPRLARRVKTVNPGPSGKTVGGDQPLDALFSTSRAHRYRLRRGTGFGTRRCATLVLCFPEGVLNVQSVPARGMGYPLGIHPAVRWVLPVLFLLSLLEPFAGSLCPSPPRRYPRTWTLDRFVGDGGAALFTLSFFFLQPRQRGGDGS